MARLTPSARRRVVGVLVAVAAGGLGVYLLGPSLWEVSTWRRQASPGALSSAHASLEADCAACHTPYEGVEAANCVLCHANNTALLERQPTVFHAGVESCSPCHVEHLGAGRRPTEMNHAALARLGLGQLGQGTADSEEKLAHERLLGWLRAHGIEGAGEASHPNVSPVEATLDCANCHANKDPHFELFGRDCAACHGTLEWGIPAFRHPSPRSTDCAECHEAPPSHFMEHFRMVSARVARQPEAEVSQCFLCHQTDAWNSIKGVGFYKHH